MDVLVGTYCLLVVVKAHSYGAINTHQHAIHNARTALRTVGGPRFTLFQNKGTKGGGMCVCK